MSEIDAAYEEAVKEIRVSKDPSSQRVEWRGRIYPSREAALQEITRVLNNVSASEQAWQRQSRTGVNHRRIARLERSIGLLTGLLVVLSVIVLLLVGLSLVGTGAGIYPIAGMGEAEIAIIGTAIAGVVGVVLAWIGATWMFGTIATLVAILRTLERIEDRFELRAEAP